MFLISSLAIFLLACEGGIPVRKKHVFSIDLNDDQAREIEKYIGVLSADEILFGLRFSYSRSEAEKGGYLLPGRKSLVKKETRGLNADQAEWRLKRWKEMIRTYRAKGYSYPTISRIKKQIRLVSQQKR